MAMQNSTNAGNISEQVKKLEELSYLKSVLTVEDVRGKKSGKTFKLPIPTELSDDDVNTVNEMKLFSVKFDKNNKKDMDKIVTDINYGRIQNITIFNDTVAGCCSTEVKKCSNYDMFRNDKDGEEEWFNVDSKPIEDVDKRIENVLKENPKICFVFVGDLQYPSGNSDKNHYIDDIINNKSSAKYVPCHLYNKKLMQYTFIGLMKPVLKQSLDIIYVTDRKINIDVYFFEEYIPANSGEQAN